MAIKFSKIKTLLAVLVFSAGVLQAMPFTKAEQASNSANSNDLPALTSVGIANPAAVYCQDLGYVYKNVEESCVFPDNTKCNAWDFLKGKCGKKYSYCNKMGFDIETLNDGKNAFSSEYAVCVDQTFDLRSFNLFNKKKTPVTDLFQLNKKIRSKCLNAPKLPQNNLPIKGAEQKGDGSPFEGPLLGTFDWRNLNGKNWLTPVKNQGSCGSCWAFSAVGVVESLYKINGSFADLDLSEENLVSDCFGEGSCCGGWHYEALDFIKNMGITNEEYFPYVDDTCKCKSSSCSAELVLRQYNKSDSDNILDSLRNFRDKKIKTEYTNAYYEYSPDIEKVLIRDPLLAKDAAELIIKYMSAIKYIAGDDNGKDLKIDKTDIEQIISFSEKLKISINKNKEKIEPEKVTKLLGLIENFETAFKLSDGKSFSQFFQSSEYFENNPKKLAATNEDEEVECQCEYNNINSSSNVCSNTTCSDRISGFELWKIADWHSVDNSQDSIKRYLISKGPLSVAMGMGDDYGGSFNKGIYQCSNDSGVNHAVVIVGYNDEEGCWIVRNSWGLNWEGSNDGYFKVGYNECSIENHVYYADYADLAPYHLPNQPDENDLGQFKSDGATAIGIGSAIDENSIIIKSRISHPDNLQVKLQVELRRLSEYGGEFNEGAGGLKESEFVDSGETAIININENELSGGGGYHWRARVIDENEHESGWVEFGNNDISDADFTKILPVPYYHQGDTDWCVPTAMSMILKYYGKDNAHSWDIAKEWGRGRDEELWWSLQWWPRTEEYGVREYFNTSVSGLSVEDISKDDFNAIKNSINNNMPVFYSIGKLDHAVVIIGYEVTDGEKRIYLNDSAGYLSQENIGEGHDYIARKVKWNDLMKYVDIGTYAMAVGGESNSLKGTLDIDMYRTNGFYFGEEGNRIYSWAYGDDIGMGWKSQSDRSQLLSKKDLFGYKQFITNHTASEQSYKLKIGFSSDNNEYWADPILIDNVEGYDNKVIAFHPVPLESVLGDNYGEYEIALSLWGGDDFSEKYDEIEFPKLSYSCTWCSGNIIPLYLNGQPEQMIDVVFVPDKSYQGYMDDFINIVKGLINEQYFKIDKMIGSGYGTIPTNYKERFNFYVYTGGFSTNPETCGATLPLNFDVPFADSIGTIVNQNDIIGCTTSLGPPSRWVVNKTGNVVLHESMHSIFSLIDEYDIKYNILCRDRTYREQLTDATNLWSSLANCQNDVKSAAFSLGNCKQLAKTGPPYCATDWFRYDTDTPNPDLMTACASGCNVSYVLGEADVRRINFVYNNWLKLSGKIKGNRGIQISFNINNNKISWLNSEVVSSYPNIGLQSDNFIVELLSSTNGALLKYGISDPRINIPIQGSAIEYPVFNDNVDFNLIIPWEENLKLVKIEDKENPETNIIVDVSETIFDFCQKNPSDLACLNGDQILETQIAITKMEYGETDILTQVTQAIGDNQAPLLLSELKQSTVDLEDYTPDGKLNPEQKKKLKMKFKFLETAGNEYQGKSINVNFKFLATQEEQ